jgi:predicted nucleic acid-binding protein
VTVAFVDTSAWLALSDDTDSVHHRAMGFYRSLPRTTRLVTTNYVVSEAYTWLRYRSSHRHALGFHRLLTGSIDYGATELEWIGPERHAAAWGIFERFHDQVLSFTDCSSAVVARQRRVDFVFAFDSDFSIFGFDVRPNP